MATADKTIEITDIGAIEHLAFTVPAGGGVVVLRGPNGAGKSTALDAISAAATGKGKLPIKDGADRGEVRLDDVLLKVGKVNRRSGELDVSVLTGKYTIVDLIAPGFKDRAACDERAIKFLAQLAGSGDESLFYDLVGDQDAFREICPSDVAGDLDIVALAARVERALQKKALTEESAATGADSQADAFSSASREVDCEAEHDSIKLHADLERAIGTEARIKQSAKDAQARIEAAATAKDNLEDAEAELTGLKLADAQSKLTLANAEVVARKSELEAARKAFQDAGTAVTQAESVAKLAAQQVESAKSNELLLSRFRASVAAGEGVVLIPAAEIKAATDAVMTARAAVENGAVIRKAIDDRKRSIEWRHKAGEHRKRAEKLREAAAGTDEVLSGLIAKLGSAYFVKRGGLMVKSHRGQESVWDLSDGERVEIAVTVVATFVGKGGRLPIPQPYWEGLDWEGRKRLAAHMRRVGVTAITAEADKSEAESGGLRAEVFNA